MSIDLLKTHKSFGGLTQFWEHESKTTKTKMKFSSFMPSQKAQGCLIWLSGLTCTEENFITKAGAQRYLEEHQLAVICPDTSPRGLNLPGEHESYDFGSGAGFYLDATTEGYRDHYNMKSYILTELYQFIMDDFKIDQNKISIFGHSMGGHGALTLGLSEPDKFQSVSAFSPIVHPTACPWGKKAFSNYLGEDQEQWRAYDATELVRSGSLHPQAILIEQGLADEFLKEQLLTEDFVSASKASKQELVVNYREGYDHSYYFISSFVGEHIAFHAKALDLL